MIPVADTVKRLYDDEGYAKNLSNLPKPKGHYKFKRFITAKTRPEVLEYYEEVSKLVSTWQGVCGVISNRRIGYKTNYYFIKTRLGHKHLTLYIRGKNGLWRQYEINAGNDIIQYTQMIKEAYLSSFRPVQTQTNT